MVNNPKQGEIIKAKETASQEYDDILGLFRRDFVRNVESAIVYSLANAADVDKPVYRLGVSDLPNRPSIPDFGTTEVINSVPYFFSKNNAKLIMEDVFGPNTMVLPDDGQVPQNTGDLVTGQVSYFDVNGGNGLSESTVVSASITDSVAHAIAQHTIMLSRVRKATIMYRMATTAKGWNSKTYPHTFESIYTVQAKGDTLVQFEDLYTFPNIESKTGITSMADPFSSALEWIALAQSIASDLLRGPKEDENDLSEDGPDPYGVPIDSQNLKVMFNRMKALWEQSKEYNMNVILDYCHSSCHASCHKSRSRR